MIWDRFSWIAIIISFQLFAGCDSGDQSDTEVVVFAATSLRDVVSEIGESYTEDHETEVVFNFAGSNVLAQQIAASPKADIFLSANQHWMDFLENAGSIEPASRISLLSNRLVVIGNKNSRWEIETPQDLCELNIKYLALGNPEAVPAGRYAREWLRSGRCNGETIWETVEQYLSPAPDVRAALGMVEADTRIIGIVYQTDAAISEKVRVLYEVPLSEGPKIIYSAARIKNASNSRPGGDFLEYLQSEEAAVIFEQYGFITLGR